MPQTTFDSGLPPTPLYLDKKRFAWLFSVIGPGLSLVGTVAVSFFDVGTWILFFPMVFFYGLIPLLDFYLGEDTNNPPDIPTEA